ncbi:MAG: methyltransferase domain-containing protein [Gammaproteobacteria bacterium]|nr:methyltransferase domain-containing protein [Gammaproteobacteria bacterium]
MNPLDKFKKNIDSHVSIAEEIESRLLEQFPTRHASMSVLDIRHDSDISLVAGGKLEYPTASFDAVIAHLLIACEKDVKIFFNEVYRILRPTGIFLFSTLTKNFGYTAEQLINLLSAVGLNPVFLERDCIQFEYESYQRLFQDLEYSEISERDVDIQSVSEDDIILSVDVFLCVCTGENRTTSTQSCDPRL